jgi:hypothetical protein
MRMGLSYGVRRENLLGGGTYVGRRREASGQTNSRTLRPPLTESAGETRAPLLQLLDQLWRAHDFEF